MQTNGFVNHMPFLSNQEGHVIWLYDAKTEWRWINRLHYTENQTDLAYILLTPFCIYYYITLHAFIVWCWNLNMFMCYVKF